MALQIVALRGFMWAVETPPTARCPGWGSQAAGDNPGCTLVSKASFSLTDPSHYPIKKPGMFSGLKIFSCLSLTLRRSPYSRQCCNFFASSKNLARPMSVKGCFSKPKMGSNGQVHTFAPNSAALTMWSELRIEAASISVL